MDDEADEALMTGVARGDRGAYDILYRRWKDPVFRFLCRRTGARSAAEEAHQEVWLRVYRFAGRYQAGRPFRSWLFAIAANCGRDAVRPQPELFGFVPAGDEPADLGLRVATALARLDADERRLVLLTIEGFDGPELAEMLGIGAGAARMRLSRARQRLRELIGGGDA